MSERLEDWVRNQYKFDLDNVRKLARRIIEELNAKT